MKRITLVPPSGHLAADQVAYRRKLTAFLFFNSCCALIAWKFGNETALLVALIGDRLHSYLWLWE
jgi:hypothetical protein